MNRNENQIALIDLVKEAINKGGLTDEIVGILHEWSCEYDSFQDVWNLFCIK